MTRPAKPKVAKLSRLHIYCNDCGEVSPMLSDFMPAIGKNEHAATDLICSRCCLVIATLHHLKIGLGSSDTIEITGRVVKRKEVKRGR